MCSSDLFPSHDNGGSVTNSNCGSVRVYQYNDISWIQLGQDIDGEYDGDNAGRSVALSSDGRIVAIGAIGNDGNGISSGSVRVYQYNYISNTWSKIEQDIDGEAAGDLAGYSISLSSDGSIIAIGAYSNDGNGNNSGSVRLYKFQNSNTNTIS